MAAYISLDICIKFSIQRYILFLKGVYQFYILYRDIFSGCSLISGSISETIGIFSRIFWVLPIDYSLYKKTILGMFVYLFICKVTTVKVICVSTNSQAETCLICERAIFPQNARLVFQFQYIENYPVEKLCKVLEMGLKTYTPVSLISVFEKIKFKVLHYV